MLRSIAELGNYKVMATDGEIGQVHDFFFDDTTWQIRYLVVNTGNWLWGRKVLLAPPALGQPDRTKKRLPVSLTKEQVENSPSVDLDQPISYHYEMDLYRHYVWDPYWATSSLSGRVHPMLAPVYSGAETPASTDVATAATVKTQTQIEKLAESKEDYNPHLRSMKEVEGYHIQAIDGEIGHVETFIIDDEQWSLMYFVVDTRNWLPGKKVLVALSWIEDIDWFERSVSVSLRKETIKNSPEYDPSEPVNRQYESVLYDYYGRPIYWKGS